MYVPNISIAIGVVILAICCTGAVTTVGSLSESRNTGIPTMTDTTPGLSSSIFRSNFALPPFSRLFII